MVKLTKRVYDETLFHWCIIELTLRVLINWEFEYTKVHYTLLQNKSKGKSTLVPKFGEWDANDSSTANGYTVIFNKIKEEKRGGKFQSPPNNSASNAHKRKAFLGKTLSVSSFFFFPLYLLLSLYNLIFYFLKDFFFCHSATICWHVG